MESRHSAPSHGCDHVYVDAFDGVVVKNGVSVALSPRERTILLALAVHPGGLSRERLADLVYADSPIRDGSEAVKVHVHRLRRRVGPTAITRRGYLYALADGACADLLADLRERLASKDLQCLSLDQLEKLRLLARKLRSPGACGFEYLEWYANFVTRHHRAGRQLALEIAKELTRRERFLDAIEVATELTFEDPCDEEAWETIIRAQLTIGQRTAALYAYRFLASALERELGVQPSVAITALIPA